MLMEEARAARGSQGKGEGDSQAFEPMDWRAHTPQDQMDVVERVIAAGAKLMYSPDMRDELRQAVQADMPVDQKLADNVVGLLLTLDQKAQGGLPVGALFPAAMGLMNEAAEVLAAAGQPVSQEAYNDAALRAFVLIGKKLGGTDEQIQQAAGAAFDGPGQGGDAGAPAEAAPAPQAPGPGGQPPSDDPEMAGMKAGMQ